MLIGEIPIKTSYREGGHTQPLSKYISPMFNFDFQHPPCFATSLWNEMLFFANKLDQLSTDARLRVSTAGLGSNLRLQ